MDWDFRLSPDLDAAALAQEFAREGRVTIDGLLAGDCARRLHDEIRQRDDWVQVVNSGDQVFELNRSVRAEMDQGQVAALDQAVAAGARNGFQYRYESIRVPDGSAERASSADPLAAFASWLSQGEARHFLRQVTGFDGIEFADAQATAYSPGDLLTGHDDAVEGKGRFAAYVLGLTPKWRLEWGGLLLFHEGAEDRASAIMPGFNQLNIFAVPQLHSVSEVGRAAAYRRYSITGWLRR